MPGEARFIHTSDWQVGRMFRFADDVTLGVLADARIEVISRIGALARTENAPLVLVAGDIYDVERPTERTLRQPIERMAAFADVGWHLIPGNHDPHRPGGAWDRLLRTGLPANVSVHVEQVPAPIGGMWLLPSALRERHATGDPTDCFDAMPTPEGAPRIGLAHGSIRGFGDDGTAGHNRISTDRTALSGLAYLALGDWHGAQAAAPRTWYSGTPEIDDFSVGGNGGGEVLVVAVDGPSATPVVRPHRVGQFYWHRLDQSLFGRADIDALEARLRGMAPTLDRTLVRLVVTGSLTLGESALFDERIENGMAAALRMLRIDRTGLMARPDGGDLEAIEPAGPIRLAAERLAAGVDAGDPVAGAALLRLAHFTRRMRTETGS